MSSWKSVQQYLLSVLPREVSTSQSIAVKTWIKSLAVTSDSQRLGVSIAIDLKSGALPPQTIGKILTHLDMPTGDPRHAFFRAVEKYPEKQSVLAASAFVGDSLASDVSYVRVLSLQDFVRYYAHYLSPSPLDLAAAREIYFGSWADRSLETVRDVWTGGNGVVWITSSQDLRLATGGKPKEKHATLINDALGLGYPPGSDLIMVAYPDAFSISIGCAQPTSLDNSWRYPGGSYISYPKRDSWGRTCSSSGRKALRRERVHAPIKNLTAHYTVRYIGSIDRYVESPERILAEAYNRAASVL